MEVAANRWRIVGLVEMERASSKRKWSAPCQNQDLSAEEYAIARRESLRSRPNPARCSKFIVYEGRLSGSRKSRKAIRGHRDEQIATE